MTFAKNLDWKVTSIILAVIAVIGLAVLVTRSADPLWGLAMLAGFIALSCLDNDNEEPKEDEHPKD